MEIKWLVAYYPFIHWIFSSHVSLWTTYPSSIKRPQTTPLDHKNDGTLECNCWIKCPFKYCSSIYLIFSCVIFLTKYFPFLKLSFFFNGEFFLLPTKNSILIWVALSHSSWQFVKVIIFICMKTWATFHLRWVLVYVDFYLKFSFSILSLLKYSLSV